MYWVQNAQNLLGVCICYLIVAHTMAMFTTCDPLMYTIYRLNILSIYPLFSHRYFLHPDFHDIFSLDIQNLCFSISKNPFLRCFFSSRSPRPHTAIQARYGSEVLRKTRWKMDAWKTTVSVLGVLPILFKGEVAASFREGMHSLKRFLVKFNQAAKRETVFCEVPSAPSVVLWGL